VQAVKEESQSTKKGEESQSTKKETFFSPVKKNDKINGLRTPPRRATTPLKSPTLGSVKTPNGRRSARLTSRS